jgi:hypothetical protein
MAGEMRIFLGSTRWPLGVLFVSMLGLQGCATYSQQMAPIRQTLVQGDVSQALAQFNKAKPSKDDLLYLLQKGYLSHLSGDWAASNEAFEAAERRYEELYTVSISNEALALVTSDNIKPYRSDSQEMAMIPYYRIFNYVQLGKMEDALVEARKANHKHVADLSKLDQMPEKDIRYKAFLNYYTGLLFASQGESNDALVSLRAAYKLYRNGKSRFGLTMPKWLAADYYDAAVQLDAKNDANALIQAHPKIEEWAKKNRSNNLVVFFESGFVPYRQAVEIFLPLYKSDDGKQAAQYYVSSYGGKIYSYQTKPAKLDQFLRISFPKLISFMSVVSSGALVLTEKTSLTASPALDLGLLTSLQFKDDSGGILLKTLLRTLLKQGALGGAKKQSEGMGWLMNALNVVTEQADTRTWLLLPERIDILKTSVPADAKDLVVQFRGPDNVVIEEKKLQLNPSSKHIRWLSARCFK